MKYPRIVDNDRGEISAHMEDGQVRSWEYRNPDEHRTKMLMAHEYVEGWYNAMQHLKKMTTLRDIK